MHWPGNLKKYTLSNGRLVGQDGRPAVDSATGFFKDGAFSLWSTDPDGDRVKEGGAAGRTNERRGCPRHLRPKMTQCFAPRVLVCRTDALARLLQRSGFYGVNLNTA